MEYIARDRIGPFEDGPMKDQYVEAGQRVPDHVFNPASIPILVELGVLVEATDESPTIAAAAADGTPASGIGVAPEDEAGAEPSRRRRKNTQEAEHATDDSHGN